MLLVWVFALVSSIVNACVTDHGPWTAAAFPERQSGPVQHLHHHGQDATGDVAAHEHLLPTAETGACAKFCIDKSTSTPVYKQPVDPLDTVWLAPPPTAATDAHAALQRVGAFHAEHMLFGARIPIPIAFLRLTL